MKRRFFNWVVVWVVLTGLSLALRAAVRHGGGVPGAFGDVLALVANGMNLVSIPARSLLRGVGIARHCSPTGLSALSAGIGWLAVCAFLLVVSAARARMVGDVSGRSVDVSRRRFLINTGCGAAVFGVSAAGAKAAIVDPGAVVLRRYGVRIRGLPVEFDGLRIVQVSDTHLGPAVSATHIRGAVGLALRRRPDVVVLTGDYIEAGNLYIEQAAEIFAPLVGRGGARLGVLGVLGNHDFFGDAGLMRSALERVGVRMIDHSRLFLDAADGTWKESAPERALCFAGLGDLDEDRTDVAAAFGGVARDVPRILLCHQPDTVELPEVRRERIDLVFCGHTHGGQVALPLIGAPVIPSRYGQKYAGGLVKGPTGPVVVSRGVGMSVLPVRWNVPPEVVEVRLHAG
ncbi:MAG: metallophosphoesterase [Phycisphaerae bacterium]|nr:metallophosphoesterase [Phycisphaerae bacterium]